MARAALSGSSWVIERTSVLLHGCRSTLIPFVALVVGLAPSAAVGFLGRSKLRARRSFSRANVAAVA
eukprot:1217346-Alexandrium_andersonii.AAC.1